MKTKRLIALILCLALFCTLFAGCGKDDAKGDTSSNIDASTIATKDKKDTDSNDGGEVEEISADNSYADFVYVPTYKDIPLPEGTSVNNFYFINDRFYLVCYEAIGQKTETWIDDEGNEQEYSYDEYGTVLYTMSLDFTNLTKVEGFKATEVPEDKEGSSYLSSLTVAKDGSIWVFENLYLYHYDDNYEYHDDGNTVIIRHLDAEGNELCTVDAGTLFPDSEYIYINGASAQTDDGSCIIYEGNSNSLTVIDAQGKKLYDFDFDNYINQFVTLSDGKLYASYYGESGICLAPIDLTAKSIGDAISIPDNVYSIIAGDGKYDIYYNTELEFCGYDFETETSATLIKWLSCDIDTDEMSSLTVLPDGTICALFTDYSGDYAEYQVATFEKADPSTLPEKITLTLACMYVDYDVRRQVINYNRSSDKYRIEIIDYSQYNTDEDYSAGTTKLNTEIISGKAPDILVSSDLPMEMYAKKGLFVDLYTLIDSDSEMSRDDLMTDILSALEIDGKLYTAASYANYSTILGPTSVVGDRMGWTIDELIELQKTMPSGMSIFVNTTRSEMLYTILRMNLDSYIDWTTGECKFDTGEFAKMLEFANSFPLDIDWETDYVDEYTAIAKGQCLLTSAYIEDFYSLLTYNCLYNGDVSCIGFPSENSCGTMVQTGTSLAISSTCKDVDGAWQFVRTFFTEEYQEENVWYGFRTNKAAFEANVEDAMEKSTYTDENGNEVEQPYQDWEGDGYHIITYAPTQEDVDEILALIKAVGESGCKYSWDEDVYNIISEEAEYYFNGQKTADDVANIIQSRVKIYVSEHML